MTTYSEKNCFFEENSSLIFVNLRYAESDSSFILEISQRSSVHESTLNSSDAELHSPTLKNVIELGSEVRQEFSQWEQENEYFSLEQIETSLPDVMDEEVIGIITMEDVMEELLQVSMVLYVITSQFYVNDAE